MNPVTSGDQRFLSLIYLSKANLPGSIVTNFIFTFVGLGSEYMLVPQ
jgi:hypothetical protein